MTLKEIIKDIKATVIGNVDIEIKGIAYDSRKVQEGYLFVAIKGFETDGHKYIESAIKNGAVAVLGEDEVECGCTYVKAQDSRRALSVCGAAFYNNPEKKLKVIGITGTNGKTTTTYLVRQIMMLKGLRCDLIGTNQIIIGDEISESGRTTPESLDLFAIFDKMVKSGGEYVVMEVSSHSLELQRVYGIEFETAVITNITQDHLDFHKTMDNYAKAKAKLFKMSKSAAINADDPYCELMKKEATGKVITYSLENDSDIKAQNLKMSERGVIFDLCKDKKIREMRLGIPGKFSVYNALSAICACINIGIDMEDIEKGLVLAKSVKGRIEVVRTNTPYTVIIDYAHTPDGLENIISAVRGFAKARIITVFGCGGNRDKTKRPQMGEIAENLSDIAVVTSDNPRCENPHDIIEDILKGMKKDNHTVIENRKEAIRYAMEIAQEGDIIVLAGKGHETYQEIEHVKHDFDERVIVKEILANA
ncbi:MAG: UDP-N-acetylmuramoyl-L-alanyl-D-glutamate--2,6-diaminopimelate ligase [Clostridia bacterium]|nr:UDP-N-acetylmuramoyl-L-alanyl-D-glutamate--2,6-diaminopimelate ligase [Clostridia bacterium]